MTVNPAADAQNLTFVPGVGVKDCTEQPGGWGTPNTLFDYIWKDVFVEVQKLQGSETCATTFYFHTEWPFFVYLFPWQ